MCMSVFVPAKDPPEYVKHTTTNDLQKFAKAPICSCMPSSPVLLHGYFLVSTSVKTLMLKDVGIEVPKSIETRSKCSMHADKGRG